MSKGTVHSALQSNWFREWMRNVCPGRTKESRRDFLWEMLANVITWIPVRSCIELDYLRHQRGFMSSITRLHVMFGSVLYSAISAIYFGKELYEEFYIKVRSIEFFLQFLWALLYHWLIFLFQIIMWTMMIVKTIENRERRCLRSGLFS